MKKLYIQTYGCQMNQYDSERIAQVLARQRLCRKPIASIAPI